MAIHPRISRGPDPKVLLEPALGTGVPINLPHSEPRPRIGCGQRRDNAPNNRQEIHIDVRITHLLSHDGRSLRGRGRLQKAVTFHIGVRPLVPNVPVQQRRAADSGHILLCASSPAGRFTPRLISARPCTRIRRRSWPAPSMLALKIANQAACGRYGSCNCSRS